MDWYLANPAVAEATRLFLARAREWPDPLVAWSATLDNLDQRLAWTLLGSALHQGIALPALSKFLGALHSAIGADGLHSLPAPRESLIDEAMRRSLSKGEWELAPQVPGIIWSVGLFIRQRGEPLSSWLARQSPRSLWRDCGEIHYMGRSGATRPKVLAWIQRLRTRSPIGLGFSLLKEGGEPPVPITPGARRWMAWVGPYKASGYGEATPERKAALVQDVYSRLSPDDKGAASHGLSFYTEPDGSGYLCSTMQNGCSSCPMIRFCPRALRSGGLFHA